MDKNSPQTVGYLRVSTIDQDIDKNRADILHLANEKNMGKVRFVEEKVSGKISWKKRKLADVMDELGDNDNIVVSELSRLSRSMLECMEILSIATFNRIYEVKVTFRTVGLQTPLQSHQSINMKTLSDV